MFLKIVNFECFFIFIRRLGNEFSNINILIIVYSFTYKSKKYIIQVDMQGS